MGVRPPRGSTPRESAVDETSFGFTGLFPLPSVRLHDPHMHMSWGLLTLHDLYCNGDEPLAPFAKIYHFGHVSARESPPRGEMINAVSQVFMRCRTTEEPELLHQPDPTLLCPICNRILEIPIRTNCGHTSCAECLRWHMSTSPHLGCPECHAPIDSCSPQPDRFAEKIVGALECFCPERNDGCPWIGTRAGLAAHAKECRASRVRLIQDDNSQFGKAHEPKPVRFKGWGIEEGGTMTGVGEGLVGALRSAHST